VNTNETAFSFTSPLNPPSPLDPNRAQCCIKTGLWKDASKLAEDCLSIDRSSLKVCVAAKLQYGRLRVILLRRRCTDAVSPGFI
jgi:hypothetical protein